MILQEIENTECEINEEPV